MEEKDGKTIEFDDPTTHRSGVAMVEAGRYRSPVGASGWRHRADAISLAGDLIPTICVLLITMS